MAEKKVSYQKLQSELDAILIQLQAPDIDVDEASKLYVRGMKIVSQLESYLKQTENTVKKVKQSFDKPGS